MKAKGKLAKHLDVDSVAESLDPISSVHFIGGRSSTKLLAIADLSVILYFFP
jgi:hypothetical protein